jgi:membrane protein YdbS with pleckstrin-like domain
VKSVFIVVLFTIAKLWNQTMPPSRYEWEENAMYVHNGVLVIMKNIMAFAEKGWYWRALCYKICHAQ